MKRTDFEFCLKWSILLWFVSLSVAGFSLQRNVTLAVNNSRVEDVLNLISAQTAYRFSYASTCIDKNRRVSFSVKNKPYADVLPLVLGKKVRYKVSGEYIILLPSVSEAKKDIAQKPGIPPLLHNNEISETSERSIDNETVNSCDTFFLKKIAVPDTGISIDECHRDIISKNEEKMRTRIATLIVATTLSAATISAQTTDSAMLPNKFAQVTFIYPIGTDGIGSDQNAYNLSLNMIGGFTGEVNGFEVGSVFNINNYGISGVQAAGVFNLSGLKKRQDTNEGTQIAGVFNVVNGNMPVQIAGCYNSVLSDNILQISGVANIAKTSKVQVSGVANAAKRSKAQIAGVINVAKTAKVQIAGAANIVKESPVQIGTVNIANSSATQIGVVNISRRNKFQLGVVNVRDTADGVSFGVLNFVMHGGVKEIEFATSDYIQGGVSLRLGTRQLYSILTFGSNFSENYYSTGFGLGTKAMLSKCFDIDFEAVHHNLYGSFLEMSGYSGLVQFRPVLDFSCVKHLSLFAGPAFNLSLANEAGEKINPPYLIYKVVDKPTFQSDFWIGFTAGLRYKF
ncbi:MAG: hypothetical protein PHH37_06425 [Paludibacter sp.]|nr:hypothetical protein [Paludibacter sp.]